MIRIAVLDHPDAQAAAVLGLIDLLRTADMLAQRRGGVGWTIERWADFEIAPTGAALTAVILPPSLGAAQPIIPSPALASWLRARHAEGCRLCSVCVGAFILAELGLLDGRPATTHWGVAADFSARFPAVALDVDRLLVDDGDIITAGGLMAWVDLGLLLTERHLGPAVMLETARFFLVDPGGREQRFYRTFTPMLTHGDAAILAAQRWLQSHFAEHVTLAILAAHAGLSRRTFMRRFQKATGMKTTRYLQHLRVGHARTLLEGGATQQEATWAVGYEDVGAFRSVFAQLMGLSPTDYRRRFAAPTRRQS